MPPQRRKRGTGNTADVAEETAAVNEHAGPSENHPGAELVGKRVKVWWPDDKKYYNGTVTNYMVKGAKHKILYDDGDKETLFLPMERWHVINSPPPPAQHGAPLEPPATGAKTLQGGGQAPPLRGKIGFPGGNAQSKAGAGVGDIAADSSTASLAKEGGATNRGRGRGKNSGRYTASVDSFASSGLGSGVVIDAEAGSQSKGPKRRKVEVASAAPTSKKPKLEDNADDNSSDRKSKQASQPEDTAAAKNLPNRGCQPSESSITTSELVGEQVHGVAAASPHKRQKRKGNNLQVVINDDDAADNNSSGSQTDGQDAQGPTSGSTKRTASQQLPSGDRDGLPQKKKPGRPPRRSGKATAGVQSDPSPKAPTLLALLPATAPSTVVPAHQILLDDDDFTLQAKGSGRAPGSRVSTRSKQGNLRTPAGAAKQTQAEQERSKEPPQQAPPAAAANPSSSQPSASTAPHVQNPQQHKSRNLRSRTPPAPPSDPEGVAEGASYPLQVTSEPLEPHRAPADAHESLAPPTAVCNPSSRPAQHPPAPRTRSQVSNPPGSEALHLSVAHQIAPDRDAHLADAFLEMLPSALPPSLAASPPSSQPIPALPRPETPTQQEESAQFGADGTLVLDPLGEGAVVSHPALMHGPHMEEEFHIDVFCNGVRGHYMPGLNIIECCCSGCRPLAPEDKWFYPGTFEQHAGMGACKKWRSSIKVLDTEGKPGYPLGKWLDDNGIVVKPLNKRAGPPCSSPLFSSPRAKGLLLSSPQLASRGAGVGAPGVLLSSSSLPSTSQFGKPFENSFMDLCGSVPDPGMSGAAGPNGVASGRQAGLHSSGLSPLLCTPAVYAAHLAVGEDSHEIDQLLDELQSSDSGETASADMGGQEHMSGRDPKPPSPNAAPEHRTNTLTDDAATPHKPLKLRIAAPKRLGQDPQGNAIANLSAPERGQKGTGGGNVASRAPVPFLSGSPETCLQGNGYKVLRLHDPPCFEIFALLAGYACDEVRIRCQANGSVSITAKSLDTKAAELWGVQPIKHEIQLPDSVRPETAQSVIAMTGHLYMKIDVAA